MIKNIATLALLVVVCMSCSKSDATDNNTSCQLNTANLTASYKVTSIKYKAPSFPEVDVYATYLQDCQKDDIYQLNANGVFNYNDVGTACSPSGTTSGTWSLSGNNLTIDGDVYLVTGYTCTTVTGTRSNVNTTGDLLTSTFTKQ